MGPEQNTTPQEVVPPATAQEQPVSAPKPDRFGWLKFWKKSGPKVVEGPIPGVTPATPSELDSSGPKVYSPAEQADVIAKELQSAQKVA
jgi:hypothetical protein